MDLLAIVEEIARPAFVINFTLCKLRLVVVVINVRFYLTNGGFDMLGLIMKKMISE